MTSARFIVAVGLWLIAGTTLALEQDTASRVTGHLSDPAGSGLPAVDVVLTGVDVHATYTARTDDEGRYDLPRVAAGGYRVNVRRADLVPVIDVLLVRAGQPLTSDIGTRFRADLGLALRAASADALRRWVAGGPSPAAPLEWECTSNGAPCDLVQQPPGDLAFAYAAIVALEGRPGIVQMKGVIGEDGLPSGLTVSSATSPELAVAALTALRQMRWEPARWRGVPVSSSMTIEIRF